MRRTRGVAALEFALILPVFTALFIAILDFGWMFYHHAALDSATNMGCRAGSLVDPGDGEEDMGAVQTRTQEATDSALAGLGIPCDGRCTITAVPFGTNPGRSLRCSLTFDFDPIVGLYLDPVTMESLQVARLEYQR